MPFEIESYGIEQRVFVLNMYFKNNDYLGSTQCTAHLNFYRYGKVLDVIIL